jgi:hypothetical protein
MAGYHHFTDKKHSVLRGLWLCIVCGVLVRMVGCAVAPVVPFAGN